MSLSGKLHPAGRRCVGDHSASGSAARRMILLYGSREPYSSISGFKGAGYRLLSPGTRAHHRVAGSHVRRPATRHWPPVTRQDYARPAGSGAAAAAGLMNGWPTGRNGAPRMPLTTPAAEAYQATSAVKMPT